VRPNLFYHTVAVWCLIRVFFSSCHPVKRQIRKQKQAATKELYDTLYQEAINRPEWEATSEEIIQSIIETTKADVLNLVKNNRFINRAKLIEAVETILPKVLEEIAYSYSKEVVTKEVIDQIKKKTINDLEMHLNNMMK